jgi:hypothetical protein
VDLAMADWMRQGRWLGALGRGSGWWIGDWVRYGSARYGDRYRPAARATGYDVQSLRNMAYVAGRFDVPRRRESLSFSHHAELASLSAEEQDLWLDRAEAGALSVGALRCEMRRARERAAARTARAEVHHKHTEGAAEPQPNASRIDRKVRPPPFSHSRSDPEIPERGSQSPVPEVVCPKCGHHFGRGPGKPEIDHLPGETR